MFVKVVYVYELLSFCFLKPLAQAGLICEYHCNVVFLSLVFHYWAKACKQLFCCIAVFSIDPRFKRQN